jgi:cystathionine beta-lyase/cystathionine gamma-synthase
MAHARTFLESLKIFTVAESLGAVESLAESPYAKAPTCFGRFSLPPPHTRSTPPCVLARASVSPGWGGFGLIDVIGLIDVMTRACMTHLSVPEEHRRALGISDTLIRLSVGIEDEKDVVDDVLAALAAASAIPL